MKAVIICMWHSYILCVRACIATEGVRVAVDTSSRIPQQRLLQLHIGIRIITERVEVMLAVPAGTTCDDRRDNHTVALLYLPHLATDLHNASYKLVTDHISWAHGWYVSVDEMEIGATGRRHHYLQDSVVWSHYFGVRHRLHT